MKNVLRVTASVSLVIAAVVLLVILAGWGIIRIVPAAVDSVAAVGVSISSLFKAKERIILTADSQTVNSGAPVTISWDHPGQTDTGFYSVSYSCDSGVNGTIKRTNEIEQTIACGTSHPLGNVQSVALVFRATKTGTVSVPVTVSYIRDGNPSGTLSSDITIIVSNDAVQPATPVAPTAPATPTQPAPAPTTPVTPAHPYQPTTYYGLPDLTINVSETGALDAASGLFVARNPVAGEKAAVRFTVSNIGTNVSGAWSFSAVLPNSSTDAYNSPSERSLAPGDSIEFTMGFDGVQAGSTLTLSVDDANLIAESNENNNTATVTFPYSTAGSGYNGGGTGYANGSLPDLSVRIIDTGTIDYNGQYIPNGRASTGQRAAVRVEVANIGGQPTGSWNYTSQLPIYGATSNYNYNGYNNGYYNYNNSNYYQNGTSFDPSYYAAAGSSNGLCYGQLGSYPCQSTYNGYGNGYNNGYNSGYGYTTGVTTNGFYDGGIQPSLAPGETVQLTIGFDVTPAYYGSGSNLFSITVNPNHIVNESRYDNDYASVQVPMY